MEGYRLPASGFRQKRSRAGHRRPATGVRQKRSARVAHATQIAPRIPDRRWRPYR